MAIGCSDPVADDGRSAVELAEDAAAAMADVETAAFSIEQRGSEISLDQTGLLTFESADGRYASPASAQAVVAVEASGFRTEVGAVAIEGEVWMTNPLTGVWDVAPPGFGFDPATLFDPEQGFPALLAEGAAEAKLVEPPGNDDEPTGLHLRMDVPAERLAVITSGLVRVDTETDLWVDPATSRLNEVRFAVPVADQTSNWSVAFSDYDAEVTIEAPELGATP